MTLQGRNFVGENSRFSFAGMEREPETLLGNAYTSNYRMLDVRVGRWFTSDPKSMYMTSYSPYSYAYNSPILFIDPLGDIPWPILLKYVSTSTFNGITAKARLSMNFNQRRINKKGDPYYHEGTDINWGSGKQDEGIPVVATAGGTAQYKHDPKESGAGHYLEITHDGNKYKTRYLHLNANTISHKTAVTEGEIIGNISNTGTKDIHLHYELLKKENGKWKPISPYNLQGELIDVQKLVNGEIDETGKPVTERDDNPINTDKVSTPNISSESKASNFNIGIQKLNNILSPQGMFNLKSAFKFDAPEVDFNFFNSSSLGNTGSSPPPSGAVACPQF